MVFVNFLVLIFLWNKVEANFYYETDTRIIIVTGEYPEDGHLRLFRSASARNLNPVLLKIPNRISEVEEIAKYFNSISFQDNEVGLITPSGNYIATNDASQLSMNVAKVALMKDGNVVMGYPMDRNLSAFSTPVDATVEQLEDMLNSLHNTGSYYPSPESLEEWKLETVLNSKYRRMMVKQKKYQYKYASIYDENYCAFAGLTKTLKNMFDKLVSQERGNVSLTEICKTLYLNESLSFQLRVVKDYDGHVFKGIEPSLEGAILIKDPKSKEAANHLESDSYSFSPLTFALTGKLPYIVANFASGDIIVPAKRNVQYYDSKIQNLTEYFNGLENLPIVHIVSIITSEGQDFEKFLQNIAGLSYPNSKTKIDILFHPTEPQQREDDIKKLQDIIQAIQNDNSTAFQSLRAVVIDSDIYAVYEKAWSFAKEIESNYTFLVHSSVHFTDRNVIETLLKQNRKVVSPILESKNGECNFKADYENEDLKDNLLSEPFSMQFEDLENENITTIGLLQVPYVFGAILLRNDVVLKMNFYFNLCPATCREDDESCLKKKDDQQCEDNYFRNLRSSNPKVWGMICKNLVDYGFIIYLNNENIYGDFNLIEEKNEESHNTINEKEEEDEGKEEEYENEIEANQGEFTSAIIQTPLPHISTDKKKDLI